MGAIKDCSAALELNPDLGKAYRVRGIALRKLGKYRDAKSDLAQAPCQAFRSLSKPFKAFQRGSEAGLRRGRQFHREVRQREGAA